MKKKLLLSIVYTLLLVSFWSCKKETEELDAVSIDEIYPLEPGKFIIYQLDSTALLPFGTGFKTVSFQIKDLVDAEIEDAAGRSSYRIVRSMKNEDGSQWIPMATFLVTPLSKSLEVVDDSNLRTIKLQAPVVEYFSWRGNTYIDTYSQNSSYKHLDNWNFGYENVNNSFPTPMKVVENTVTILQRDEVIGSEADKYNYFEKNYSIEVYGKGIGLIYKEFIHKEYQPGNTPPSSGRFVDGSYGIKLTMIDHN